MDREPASPDQAFPGARSDEGPSPGGKGDMEPSGAGSFPLSPEESSALDRAFYELATARYPVDEGVD